MVASNRTIKYSHKFSCVLVYFENLLENKKKVFSYKYLKKNTEINFRYMENGNNVN